KNFYGEGSLPFSSNPQFERSLIQLDSISAVQNQFFVGVSQVLARRKAKGWTHLCNMAELSVVYFWFRLLVRVHFRFPVTLQGPGDRQSIGFISQAPSSDQFFV
ncbi:hypothetical protein AVEN_142632-1, partial [Araneus ventricosus]